MTDRAAKILRTKRKMALQALESKNRLQKDGLFLLRDDEAVTLSNWLKELLNERVDDLHGQDQTDTDNRGDHDQVQR